jgi:hypothetical protein
MNTQSRRTSAGHRSGRSQRDFDEADWVDWDHWQTVEEIQNFMNGLGGAPDTGREPTDMLDNDRHIAQQIRRHGLQADG